MGNTANDYLDRNQKPRVHIKYPVATHGAIKKKEIPFIMGVMAGLSGQPKTALPEAGEREFKNVDKENFDKFLAAQTPRVKFGVPNKLGTEGGEAEELAVDIEFKSMKDFDPGNVTRNVPALNKLLQAREQLDELLTKVEGKQAVEARLNQLLQDPELLAAVAEKLKKSE